MQDAQSILYHAQMHLVTREPKARDPLPETAQAREVRTAIRILAALEELIMLTRGG